tara:strand:+ start:102 stop:305 length:204 start_codon:yes stop_codon:yes gene_type:complete
MLSVLPEDPAWFLVVLFLVVPVVCLVLFVKAFSTSLILVDHSISVLVHILPVVLLAGTHKKGEDKRQ